MLKNGILIFLLCIGLQACDNIKNEYGSWEQLNNIVAHEKAWLPYFFYDNPHFKDNVFDVVSIHDIDTNESWGRFRYDYSITEYLNTLQKCDSTLYQISNKVKKRMKKLGIDMTTDLYVDTLQRNFIWFIFVDDEKKTIGFYGKLYFTAYSDSSYKRI